VSRLIAAIIAFSLAIALLRAVLAAALIAILVGGLIFRTRETVTLLVFFGGLAFLEAHPAIGFGLIGMIIVAALVDAFRKKTIEAAAEPPRLLE
jgi:hypothetical protein